MHCDVENALNAFERPVYSMCMNQNVTRWCLTRRKEAFRATKNTHLIVKSLKRAMSERLIENNHLEMKLLHSSRTLKDDSDSMRHHTFQLWNLIKTFCCVDWNRQIPFAINFTFVTQRHKCRNHLWHEACWREFHAKFHAKRSVIISFLRWNLSEASRRLQLLDSCDVFFFPIFTFANIF